VCDRVEEGSVRAWVHESRILTSTADERLLPELSRLNTYPIDKSRNASGSRAPDGRHLNRLLTGVFILVVTSQGGRGMVVEGLPDDVVEGGRRWPP